MELTSNNTIASILERHKAELLAYWLKELQNTGLLRDDLMRAKELRSECQESPILKSISASKLA